MTQKEKEVPMKVFEYIAMGKAIVVEDTEAAREIMIGGVNAHLREKLGRNVRELVMREHTWERRGKVLIGLYKKYLKKRMVL